MLRILLAPESVARKLGNGNKTVAGYALSTDGRGIRAAYVFAERAKKLALILRERPQVIAEGLVLGHVIAHEIGHLMLPPGHSRTGLMQARMNGSSLDEALYGELYLTSNQSQLIRMTLLVKPLEFRKTKSNEKQAQSLYNRTGYARGWVVSFRHQEAS